MKKFLLESKGIMLNQIAISFLCLAVIPGVFMLLRDMLVNALFVFSIAAGLYLFFLDFVEANRIGTREVKNPLLYKTNAFKGVLLGLIGQLPSWILTFILLILQDKIFRLFVKDFRVYMSNIFTLQYIWILKPLNFTRLSYILSFLIVPLICGIGYYLGIKGFYFEDKFGPVKNTDGGSK